MQAALARKPPHRRSEVLETTETHRDAFPLEASV